jgi:hypothetical protein
MADQMEDERKANTEKQENLQSQLDELHKQLTEQSPQSPQPGSLVAWPRPDAGRDPTEDKDLEGRVKVRALFYSVVS